MQSQGESKTMWSVAIRWLVRARPLLTWSWFTRPRKAGRKEENVRYHGRAHTAVSAHGTAHRRRPGPQVSVQMHTRASSMCDAYELMYCGLRRLAEFKGRGKPEYDQRTRRLEMLALQKQ
jgi:hypothetical protein